MKKINIDYGKFSVRIFLAVLSGILTFMAFPPLDISVLGWFCLVPLFLAVRYSNLKQSIILGSITGIVSFSAIMYWLLNVTVPGTIILIVYLSLFIAVFAIISRIVLQKNLEYFIIPFVWVVLEFIRANLFTGFPWALLAYTQYQNHKLIQIADLTGSYGISFILVAFNVAAFAWISKSKRKISYMMIALIFIAMCISYSRYKLDNYVVWSSPRVSVVQGNIPQELKWEPEKAVDIFSVYKKLSLESAEENPDIIMWPETAFPYLVEKDIYPAKEMNELTERIKIPILTGCVLKEKEAYYNAAILFDKGTDIDMYKKIHLVPFGEYIPFNWLDDLLRQYVDKPIGDFYPGKEYVLFPLVSSNANTSKEKIIRTTNYYQFGTLICFEDIFPYVARNFVKKGADFLVNITNDAWFKKTAASRQHLQASVFRAVENRVPLIRSANTGISCFIDSTGKIRSILNDSGKEIFVRGILTGAVEICPWRSFYTVYGDVFVLFCAIMLFLLFSTEWYMRFKDRKNKK